MGFWNWFTGGSKAKNTNRKHSAPLDPRISQAFGKVKRDIKKLRQDVSQADSQLAEHNNLLAEHSQLITVHTTRLNGLEELVNTDLLMSVPSAESEPISRQNTPTSRPKQPTNRLVATSRSTNRVTNQTAESLDIQDFSTQEKRILEVFLNHRDMALSYGDIAKSLQKSPNTVKNQMRQMNTKSSLFDKTTDSQSKNRFKLRPNLKITTDLDSV